MQLVYLKPQDINLVIEDVRKNHLTVNAITNSILEFGFLNPILINNQKELICGYARLKAALALNLETIPCLVVDLSAEKAAAFNIVDNQIQQLSGWNHIKKRKAIKRIGININNYGLYDEMKGVSEIDRFFEKENKISLFDSK